MSDPGSFPTAETLLDRAPQIRSLARGLLIEHHEVDDVVQETWLAAQRSDAPEARRDGGWFVGIARNVARKMHRSRTRRTDWERRGARPEVVSAYPDHAEMLEFHTVLIEAVTALDEPYRAVIYLRYFEGLEFSEIAARLDSPVPTVRSRAQRGLAQLKSRLDRTSDTDHVRGMLLLLADAGLPLAGPSLTTTSLVGFGAVLVNLKSFVALVLIAAAIGGGLWWSVNHRRTSEQTGTEFTSAPGGGATNDESESVVGALASESFASTVRGAVFDSVELSPIVDAVLTVADRELVRSDAGGRFVVEQLEASTEIMVARSGFVSRRFKAAELPSRILLAPGREVVGRVVNQGGDSVPFARVVAAENVKVSVGWPGAIPGLRLPRRYRVDDRSSVRTSADEQGRFAVTLSKAKFALHAGADGYGPGATDLFALSKVSGELVITLRDEHVLEGIVVDENGEAVADARITCRGQAAQPAPDCYYSSYLMDYEAQSDDEGRFRIAGLPDHYRSLRVEHPSFAPIDRHEAFPTGDGCEIVLTPSSWIEGRFVDDQSPSKMELHFWGKLAEEVPLDSEGGFRSEPFTGTPTLAVVRADGFLPKTVEWQHALGAVDVGDVLVERGEAIPVLVTADDGSPVGEVRLDPSVHDPTTKNWLSTGAVSTTEDGGATLVTRRGRIRLRVEAVGFQSELLDIDLTDEELPLDLKLKAGAAIVGTVLLNAQPAILDVMVLSDVRRDGLAVSAPNGRFRIESLPVGAPLTLRIGGSARVSTHIPIEPLEAGEQRDLGVIETAGHREIDGVVVDDRERPVPGATVGLSAAGDVSVALAYSDDDGRFAFTGLTPGGYQIRCAANGYIGGDELPIPDGSDDVHGLRYVLGRGAPLSRRIVDSQGQPVVGASVAVVATGGSGGGTAFGQDQVYTDERGKFHAPLVPKENLAVRVDHERFRNGWFPFETVEDVPADIVLERGAGLHVTLRMPEGVPSPSTARVSLRTERSGGGFQVDVRDGAAEKFGLDAGEFDLTVEVRGHPSTPAVPVKLVRGEVIEVEIEIPTTPDPVVVVCRDEQGSLVEGATIQVKNEDMVTHLSPGERRGEFLVGSNYTSGTVLLAEAPGFAPLVGLTLVPLIRDGRVELTLTAESGLDVVVLDAGGSPIEGAVVRARVPGAGFSERRVATTDSLGRAILRQLAEGDVRVDVRRGGETVSVSTHSLRDAEILPVEIRLPVAVKVTGVVRVNGAVVSGGTVRAYRRPTSSEGPVDAEGRFEMEVLGTGPWNFTYRNDEMMISRFLDVASASDLELDFFVSPIAGSVIDTEGNAIPNAKLTLRGPTSIRLTTDAEGQFRVKHARHGSYEIVARSLPSGLWAPRCVFTHVEPATVTLEVRMGRTVTVNVVDPAGTVVEDASVYWVDGTERTFVGAAASLAWPEGATEGVVLASGFAPTAFQIPPGLARVDVAVAPGGSLEATFPSLPYAVVAIEPLEGASLPPSCQEWRTNSRGRLVVALGAGQFRVTRPDGAFAEVEISAGATTVVTVP